MPLPQQNKAQQNRANILLEMIYIRYTIQQNTDDLIP